MMMMVTSMGRFVELLWLADCKSLCTLEKSLCAWLRLPELRAWPKAAKSFCRELLWPLAVWLPDWLLCISF